MEAEDRKRILEALRGAMRTESDGRVFYAMAASNVEDTKGREVLEQLAAEEDKHFTYLEHQYASVSEHGEFDMSMTLDAPLALEGPNAIFSDELKARLPKAHVEMSTLSIGIQLELNSMKYYQARAAEEEASEVKEFFQALASWEQVHYRALLGQYDTLKEDYWSAAGFAPF